MNRNALAIRITNRYPADGPHLPRNCLRTDPILLGCFRSCGLSHICFFFADYKFLDLPFFEDFQFWFFPSLFFSFFFPLCSEKPIETSRLGEPRQFQPHTLRHATSHRSAFHPTALHSDLPPNHTLPSTKFPVGANQQLLREYLK